MNLDFFENKYFFVFFVLFAALYKSQILPKLPDFILDFFKSYTAKIIFLVLVLIRCYKDTIYSLIIAILFILVIDSITYYEKFTDTNVDLTLDFCNTNQQNVNTISQCINIWKNKDISKPDIKLELNTLKNKSNDLLLLNSQCISETSLKFSPNASIYNNNYKITDITEDICRTTYLTK
jgi:hypothetical protein